MKVLNVELKMTIPNALSIFRLLLLPVFAALGLLIPLTTYRSTARLSVVERLRTDE